MTYVTTLTTFYTKYLASIVSIIPLSLLSWLQRELQSYFSGNIRYRADSITHKIVVDVAFGHSYCNIFLEHSTIKHLMDHSLWRCFISVLSNDQIIMLELYSLFVKGKYFIHPIKTLCHHCDRSRWCNCREVNASLSLVALHIYLWGTWKRFYHTSCSHKLLSIHMLRFWGK